MKPHYRVLIALGAAVAVAGCSFSTGPTHKAKARVIVAAHNPSPPAAKTFSARGPSKAIARSRSLAPVRALETYISKQHALPARGLSKALPAAGAKPKAGKRPSAALLAAGRPDGGPRSRELSAWDDIDYITYQVDNRSPNSGEDSFWDYVDPYYPYIDLFLTPGQSYRISVDVVLWSDSQVAIDSAKVGVFGFGDSADFYVPDDGSEIWVDLMVHPLGDAFQSQVVGGTSVGIYDAVNGTLNPTTISSTPLTPSSGDKIFYTSDARLYYFNQAASAVYEWTDISQPIDSSTPFFDTTILGGLTMYSVSADPTWPDLFWAVGQFSDGSWEYDAIDVTNAVAYYTTITTDLESGLPGSTVVPTGIAADFYGDAFISFYNTGAGGAGHPVSGVIEYDYAGTRYWADIPDTSSSWTSADSIITDLTFSGGSLYALASPNTSAGAAGDHNKGRADIWVFDAYLDRLVSNPTRVASTYSGGAAISVSGSSLSLPNKFAGMVEVGYLLISQSDFAAGGTELLSAVSLDLSEVTALP